MPPTPTDFERVKAEGLDIDLAAVAARGHEALTPDDKYRLKTWGVCGQVTPGLQMLRIRVPGGRLTAASLAKLAGVAEDVADGSLHCTTRQNLELHSVPTSRIADAVRGVQEAGLTTRSTCGHTVRNVTGCPRAGVCAEELVDVRPYVQAVNSFFLARAEHYNRRLPRRLNVSFSGCPGCMAQAQVNDLGFVATQGDGGEVGFALWAAGSLGSQPRLAHLLFGFVPLAEVLAVTQAIADVYCEHGFRERPNKARLKFLVEEWGVDRFAEAVLARLRELRPGARARREGSVKEGPDRPTQAELAGVTPQRQAGAFIIQVRVPLGDLSAAQARALAAAATAYGDGNLVLTRQQNVELHWVPAAQVIPAVRAVRAAGLEVGRAGGLADVGVCAGMEWCVWGVADSRGVAAKLNGELAATAAGDREALPLRVNVSGCSHSCAHHQAADIGLAGVKTRNGPGFEVYAGGRLGADPGPGERLGKVAEADAPRVVQALLARWQAERLPGEPFAGYARRVGREALAATVAEVSSP